MTAAMAWGATALVASAGLLLLVLALRLPARRWTGPRLAYALWALPALRLLLPPLPPQLIESLRLGEPAGSASLLFVGPMVASASAELALSSWLGSMILAIWLGGALTLFLFYAARHVCYCRRLRHRGTALGCVGRVHIIAADIDGPLAFGVFRRFIAVPRSFARDYSSREQDLALAHEQAHHDRGDLLSNWVSLIVLAAHWWNPIAWVAIRAFRADQEVAADAHVLAGQTPSSRAIYAGVLAKAAGVGALPACNLNARTNLKERLMMIRRQPLSRGHLAVGSTLLALSATAALAASAASPGASRKASAQQAVTIGVKPDGRGGYTLILGSTAVTAGATLPDGLALPTDFDRAGGCSLGPAAKPFAMVIKGMGSTETYTVMCASVGAVPVRTTLTEGLASLETMRASVASQPASAAFAESERAHALGAIDRSIDEVRATLATFH